ncbi:putative Diguanylate cyclase [Thiocapsa sp. KS1]|nr:putative Diguanylate cyclase [Thiocapsa sp. KS1]
MKDLIDIDVLTNWVSMLRAEIDGAILLADDDREGPFYEKCAHEKARVVPSAAVARRLLERIQMRQVAGVVAVVSATRPEVDVAASVFQPSLGDIASLLLCSKCCEGVLEEIGGAAWVRACDKEVGSLTDRVVALAWSLQQFFVSEGVSLAQAAVSSLIDWSTLMFSDSDVANKFGPTSARSARSLLTESLAKSRVDLLRECDGMMAMELLACATREFHPRGLRSSRQSTTSDLLGMMRLSFDLADFESEYMYWRMRAWERANWKYPLLKKWRHLDPLQVVLDQRYWESDLRVILANDSAQLGMTAVKLDLDNFKSVNEALGHSGGDDAIRIACRTADAVLSKVAEVYRRGGDELVAFAPDFRGAQADELAEELRKSIETEFESWGREKGLESTPTASIGLVDVAPGSCYDDVVRLMDESQQRAKREGKNRVIKSCCSFESSGR